MWNFGGCDDESGVIADGDRQGVLLVWAGIQARIEFGRYLLNTLLLAELL
jgi:hypothetical protein